MRDDDSLGITRPVVNHFSGQRSGCTNRVHTFDKFSVSEGAPDFGRDASHNAHAEYDVVKVGELDANLGQVTANRSHAERDHVHGPAFHTARKPILKLCPHFVRVLPLAEDAFNALCDVGYCLVFFGRYDKRFTLNPCYVGWVSTTQVTAPNKNLNIKFHFKSKILLKIVMYFLKNFNKIHFFFRWGCGTVNPACKYMQVCYLRPNAN
jgi:hypothetical protein